MERTFVMIKPDGVQRGLVGEILSRFENKGFKIVAAKFGVLAESIVEKHYEEHLAKPFYPSMKAYITSGPVFRFVLEGDNVVATVRKMNGATNPTEANPLRGDYACPAKMSYYSPMGGGFLLLVDVTGIPQMSNTQTLHSSKCFVDMMCCNSSEDGAIQPTKLTEYWRLCTVHRQKCSSNQQTLDCIYRAELVSYTKIDESELYE